MKYTANNPIVNLSFDFAKHIIQYTDKLEEIRKYNLAKQLFRSGTSIGANIREAQNAESRSDFIHKMKIAAKEAEESKYWLELCKEAPELPCTDTLFEKVIILQKVLNRIIGTSKSNLRPETK